MPVFAFTIFIGAFLLFQVEPMMAKFILPWFGGAPAVWTTCLLFFQMVLVAGYAYAHFLNTRLNLRRQVIVHLGLISLCLMAMGALAVTRGSAIAPPPSWKPGAPDFPVSRILLLLSMTVSAPYFILSTTGPLMQSWFARTHPGHSPYRLYALSNFGSLMALVSYPFIVEPALRLRLQARWWSIAYLIFAGGIVSCATILWSRPNSHSEVELTNGHGLDDTGEAPSRGIFLIWISLAACASLMLLATTNQICQDVAAIPFLWILPLALYLVSFIICFDHARWYRRAVFQPALGLTVFASCVVLCASDAGIASQIVTYSMLLFAVCMVCHGELVLLKPSPRYLTAFYLMISVGGALGGMFAAIIAPAIFPAFWEFHLAIFSCLVLTAIVTMRDRASWIHRRSPAIAVAMFASALVLPELIGPATIIRSIERATASRHVAPALFGGVIVAILGFRKKPSSSIIARPGLLVQLCALVSVLIVGSVLIVSARTTLANSLIATRNFYGAQGVHLRDGDDPEWRAYVLRSGRVIHGIQFRAPDKRREPTWYYGPSSGIGMLMLHHPRRAASKAEDRALRVGIVGLGAGTIAAYGIAGDYFRFYEINPAVIEVASAPDGYFTFLRDSAAHIDTITGDARLSMETEIASGHRQHFDILAIDAFSGDAIPVHLLTREAMEIYLLELAPHGVLAFHISNNYLDLRPVLAGMAKYFQLEVAEARSDGDGKAYSEADWMLLARDREVLEQPEISRHLRALDPAAKVAIWTDDYSNLFELLK